ncbi:MAG TPA: glucose dehydrogenase, partial [Patescibacteria group bacterium]|nr:glucose dehydrogenase [Patescibacteria group bacterium]
RLYVSHLGKISTVDASGTVTDIVTDLPSSGDHQNNQMTIGPDGKIYFGQGAATNAGIVGLDNAYPFVWLMLWPDVHDVPPKDIELEGETFLTPQPNNVLARQGRLLSWWSNFTYAVASLFARDKEASMLVRTGAFQQFGESGADRIKGQVKGNSAILRMNPDGSGLEVYAWGIRNPFGVMWSPDGQLFVTNNGYDERGSRPIANAKDDILLIRQNGWYGFPDFVNGLPVTDPQFRSVRGPSPDFLLENHPPLEQPWLTRPKHAGVTKLDFSPNSLFGAAGQMYVAEVGSEAPITGEDTTKAGYIVVRIDPATKRAETFFANREPGPEGLEYVTTRGPRHPVEVKFSPDGNALYVTDIGVIHGGLAGPGPFPMPIPGSGVIWRITREGTSATPPANLSPQPPRSTPAAGR